MSNLALELIEKNIKTQNPILDLGNCNLKSLPPEVLQCDWLESLNLSGVWNTYKWSEEGMLKEEKTSTNKGKANHLSKIPNLAPLKRLRKLILKGSFIQDLYFLEGLSNLECLDISATGVNNLSPLQSLKSLKCLIVSDCYALLDLNPLNQHAQLEVLVADDTTIVDLSSISSCISLKYLDLSGTEVMSLLPLAKLLHMREIYLESTMISDLSPLAKMDLLQTLSLSYTGILSLKHLENMMHLRRLDISNNSEINDLSPLSRCNELISLNISSTVINKLSNVGAFPRLKYLRAADTKIKNLESLAQCLELEQLDISSTNVEDISFVENLKHLKFLDISDSPVGDLSPAVRILEHQLTDASPSLFNLKYGNCELLTTPPLEVVAQGDEGVLKYFKAIKMRGKKEGLEVKILLVGESMAGKTSLCVRLLDGPDSPLPTTPERTIGLRVLTKKLPLNLSNNKVVQVNIFDFGGHSFYKPLHHFFYSKRALYIFVTKNGDDSNQYDYWFEIIKLFGGSSTVFLLHNLFSGIPCGFNPNLYANKYSYNIQTDLLKCNNLQEIKTQLTDAVEKMPLINSTYPAIWFDIKQDIEERRVTSETIPLSDLLGKYGQGSTTGMSNEEIIACLEYLHEVGTCLFYKDIPGLDKTVILNHDWAIKAVFQVLMDKKVIEGRGKFTLDDIKRIWSSEPQEGNKKISPKFHEHWYGLLELMRDFYLCFEVILNGKVFIAPELLGIRQNDQVFDWQPSDTDLILKIDYSFLPFGFFSRFISLNYKRIENDSYWKDEVILRWGNSRAHVTCNQKTIIFEIQGNDLNARRHLFEVLKSTLDDLHTESADLNPDVLVPCVCEYCVSKSPFDRHFFKLSELTKRTLNKKNTIECPIEPGYCNVIVVNILEQIEVKNQILSNKKPRPLKAFVSYSKKDIESLGHLKKHLSALVTAGSIELWDDSQIPPGEKWDDSIKSAIEEAKIIFVLLSADLLDNEYVWKEEIPHAMRRHKMGDAIIIPIKLRACNWDATELSKIQGLPFKDTYIQNEEERIRDQIWLEVVKGIEKIIVRFRRK